MRYDVIVIGGGPAGLITAATAKKNYPEKSVAIIKKEPVGMIPCGIPYIFGTLGGTEKNVLPTKGVENLGVQVLVDEVVDVNPDKKIVKTKNSEYEYDKLVLATGSEPVIPPIPGADLEGVFCISKYKDYLDKLYENLKNAENVVVVGGGFIGVEVTDEIRKMGKKVTIIEIMDHLIPAAFDEEFGKMAQEVLESHGVRVLTSTKVEKIEGNEKVEKVITNNGEIKADVVILSTGYKPRVELAKEIGLKLGDSGAIVTDEYMRTSVKDIFAVGDCVEHLCFFTRKSARIMLASTATFDARIAGANLFKLKVLRTNHGTLAVFSTSIEGLTLASAGCNEKMIREEGFDVVIGEAKVPDRHPGSIPDASTITLKLVFSRESGHLLGGQIAGGKSVGEMVNAISLAIQNRLTATELATMQIGTHPLLTSAPTAYPIVSAAENALMKMRK
ncbi:MAG: FAD-dependent oxidoreductase [Thermotogaceae bacterium]|nr:FAD-dependent oxidoreductase [Thermotogaceae bacterium]